MGYTAWTRHYRCTIMCIYTSTYQTYNSIYNALPSFPWSTSLQIFEWYWPQARIYHTGLARVGEHHINRHNDTQAFKNHLLHEFTARWPNQLLRLTFGCHLLHVRFMCWIHSIISIVTACKSMMNSKIQNREAKKIIKSWAIIHNNNIGFI